MKQTAVVEYDWKDDGGDAFRKALRSIGIYVYEAPSFAGADALGYIVSRKKLTRKEIQRLDKEYYE